MKIGINTLFLIPGEVGGSETYLRQTLLAMAGLFPDVGLVLFVNRENAPALQRDLEPFGQVDFYPLHFNAANRFARIIREQTELPLAVKSTGCDVLWSPGYTAPILCPCPRVTSILDMQYKRHPEDLSFPARLATDVLVKAAARLSDRIITISDFSKSEIACFTAARQDHIVPIRLGVDPRYHLLPDSAISRHLSSLPEALQGPYILSVANTYPHKNMHTLVEAFGTIMGEIPHRLLIVGRPRLGEHRFQKALAGVADPSRVLRLSGLRNEQMMALFRRADLFVFPSLYEGFGLPVLEAMAAGTPVVTTRKGSIPEIAGNRVLYAEPPDARNLSRKILEVLRWPTDRRARWAQAARVHAETFSWERTARQTMTVLEEAGGA